jgi:hypothetical protein
VKKEIDSKPTLDSCTPPDEGELNLVWDKIDETDRNPFPPYSKEAIENLDEKTLDSSGQRNFWKKEHNLSLNDAVFELKSQKDSKT